MTTFWFSFAFTCGIFVGKVLPKIIEWVLEKAEVRNIKDMEESEDGRMVEFRHGTWYHGNDGGAIYAKCSACGRKMNYSCYGYAYCCLCGARMDGERKD